MTNCFGIEKKVWLSNILPKFHFNTSWKREKTSDFLTISGGIEIEHWCKMG